MRDQGIVVGYGFDFRHWIAALDQCRKGNVECKYWLDTQNFHIDEAFAYNVSPTDKRQIKKIIYDHFECIEQQWNEFQRRSHQ